MALISSAVLAFTPHSQSSVCRCPNDQSPAKTNPDTDLHPISACVCLCVVQSSTDPLLIWSHRSSFRYSEFLCFEMWVQHITILTSHSDYHSHPILSCMCRLEFWEANVGFFYGNRLGEAQWLRSGIKPFQNLTLYTGFGWPSGICHWHVFPFFKMCVRCRLFHLLSKFPIW